MSQYLQIDESTRMKDLGERVGFDYVDTVLAVNGLIRKPAIFEQLEQKVLEARQGENVGWQRKARILNKMVGDSDVFETAALMSEDDWKVYQKLETFPGFIKMPPSVVLPKASDIMGDGEHIGSVTYKAVMNDLQTDPHIIKEGNFSKYSTSRGMQMREDSQMSNSYGWNIFPILKKFRIKELLTTLTCLIYFISMSRGSCIVVQDPVNVHMNLSYTEICGQVTTTTENVISSSDSFSLTAIQSTMDPL